MARVQSLVQWDARRATDAEVLADLCAHSPRDRGRRLRELALLGLRTERGGGGLVEMSSATLTPSPARDSPPAQQVEVNTAVMDDIFSDMLGNMDG